MCIRDRYEAAEASLALLIRAAMEKKSIKQFDIETYHVSMPVSYTHLRAHETVLDLVCRLLLEKKHNPNSQPHIRITLPLTSYNTTLL